MAIYSKSQTTVEGLDELVKAFAALGEEAMPKLKDAINVSGNIVLAKAKEKVPVLTGKTKAGLKLTKARINKKSLYKVIATIGASKDSAPLAPLELGHKLIFMGHITDTVVAPRPFLRPAADESKDEIAGIMAAAMNKILEQMGGIK